MQTYPTWEEYDQAAELLIQSQRVKDFSHHIFLHGVAQPGLIPWSKRDIKMPEIYDSVSQIESALKASFSGLELVVIESPRGHNPAKEVDRYFATLAIKDNSHLCAGISLNLSYNVKHERTESGRLERFPQVPFNIDGLLALGQYQQKTIDFIRRVWGSIKSFHFCTKTGEGFDSKFFLEVQNDEPVCGGNHLLKKLGLILPEKRVYLPF